MEFKDQLQRKIFLPKTPERIISLVPSQTELLVDLGLEDKIVGVTKFCIHPNHLRKCKAIVGGTKNYRFDVIDALQPDLIIGNKEENDKEGIDQLSEKYPVWMSDIFTLEDAFQMIRQIAKMTNTSDQGERVIQRINDSFQYPVPFKGTCLYLIWNDPIMVAGKDTFIDFMLEKAGFKNLANGSRYPVLNLEDVMLINPDFVLLSSEPYPFKENQLLYFKSILPESQIRLVNGEFFSWYGSRLVQSAAYFKGL